MDYSKLSDEELQKIVNEGSSKKKQPIQANVTQDFSKLSDEELQKIVDEAPQERSTWEDVKHKAGVAARGAASGLTSGAGFAGGAMAGAGLGALTGPIAPVAVPVLGLIGGLGGAYLAGKVPVNEALDVVGVPKAETKGERYLQAGSEAAVSALTPVGAGKLLLSKAARPALVKAGKMLAAAPGTQLAASEAGALISEKTDSPGLGAAAGVAVPVAALLARRAVTPFPSAVKGGASSAIKTAAAENIPLTAYQKTQRTGAGFVPPSEGLLNDQAVSFNRAAIKKTGHPGADYFTDDVASDIQKSFTPKFSGLADETSSLRGGRGIVLDKDFKANLKDAALNFYGPQPLTGKRMSFTDKTIEGIYDRLGKISASISGDEYKNLRSSLGARMGQSSDPVEKMALRSLSESLDDQMERAAKASGNTSLVDGWKEARNQYKAYKVLEDAFVSQKGEGRAIGNIDPSRYSGAVNRAEKYKFVKPGDDIHKLARVGDLISSDPKNEQDLVTNFLSKKLKVLSPTGAGVAVGSLVGQPVIGGAVGALTGKALGTKAGQAYLSNQKFAAPAPVAAPAVAGIRGALVPEQEKPAAPTISPKPAAPTISPEPAAPTISPEPVSLQPVTAPQGLFPQMLKNESSTGQFDKRGNTVISPAGAVGAAQIMEDTAPEAAAMAGLEYDRDRLYGDEEYNKALGNAYYDNLVKEFNDPILAAAAYNAGIGKVKSALKKSKSSGKPWINFVPTETQNYVAKLMPKRVASNAYAKGGPVYTHPDISSIRAKRAVRGLAK